MNIFTEKSKAFYCAAALFAIFLCGCNRTPRRELLPLAMPPYTANDAAVAARTKLLRDTISHLPLRGVGLYPSALKDSIEPQEAVRRILDLGFNRAYCYISSETELDGYMKDFLKTCAEKSLAAEIVLVQSDYYRQQHVNQLLRPFIRQYPSLHTVAGYVADLNKDLPDNAKLAGVTILINPHLFDSSNAERSHRQLYNWHDNNYGIGMDNDMLMNNTFALLRQIAEIPDLPPLTIATSDFYHEKAAAGELSLGKVSDFAQISKQVMIINSGNRPTQLVQNIVSELKDAGDKEKLLIAIPLATHVSVEAGALRRRDWNDLVRALSYMNKELKKYPAFGGIVISPLSVIDFLRQEK